MNPPIITIKASGKAIRAMATNGEKGKFADAYANTSAFAEYDAKIGCNIIYIPYKVSTKTRLHEIAHCELGHCQINKGLKTMPVMTYVQQELDAEMWAFSKCGKRLSLESALTVAHDAIAMGASLHHTFNCILKALEKYNKILNRWQRSYLWSACRDFAEKKC